MACVCLESRPPYGSADLRAHTLLIWDNKCQITALPSVLRFSGSCPWNITEKGSRQVPLNIFSSVPLFYLSDFSPGSLHGTETETLCGRCGKRAVATALLTRSLFPLQGTPLLAVGRLQVSTFSPPTSLPAPPLPAHLSLFF